MLANLFGRKNFNGVVGKAFHVARNDSVKIIRLGDGVLNGVFKVFPIQRKGGVNVLVRHRNDANELEKLFEFLANDLVILQVFIGDVVDVCDGRRRNETLNIVIAS